MKAAKFLLLFSLPVIVFGGTVRTGDSAAEVRAALGAPRGQMKIGDRQVLLFDRGEVELRSGAVSRVALLADADFSAMEAKRTVDAARLASENSRLTAEGETLKARKLADPAFAATPVAYQLAYWQNFSVRYPGVAVSDQLAMTHARVAEQYYDRQRQEQRLADLESRVGEAEARAAAAESHTSQLAGYVTDDGYGYGYGGGYRAGYGYYGREQHSAGLSSIQYHYYKAPAPIISPTNRAVFDPAYQNSSRSGGVTTWNSRNSNCTSSGHRGRM